MFDVFPEKYPKLLDVKTEQLQTLFKHCSTPTIEVFDSPSKHFRMRAEFRIWHDQGTFNYVMFDKLDKRKPIIVTHFPRASTLISTLMQPLLTELKKTDVLSYRLFQIDFLSSLSGEMLITLIYHKPLNEQWQEAATKLQAIFSIKIMGRARKQKIILTEDFIEERLSINGITYYYQQVENSFTQPNAAVNEKMLSWAVNNSKKNTGDLLELYCGNGNFTLPLARNFEKVLATEVSKTSVKSARQNINDNNVKNITILRMSSEEFTQAYYKKRTFRRLADINLADYRFSTLFIDPPRSGLDEQTLAFSQQFDNIIYISCNPLTLQENLKQLSNYKIEKFALFDQFPYTNHIECGVILRK